MADEVKTRRVCMICSEESDSDKWALEHNCTRDKFVKLVEENQRLRSLFEEITNLYERHSADDGVAKMILAKAKAALDGEGK